MYQSTALIIFCTLIFFPELHLAGVKITTGAFLRLKADPNSIVRLIDVCEIVEAHDNAPTITPLVTCSIWTPSAEDSADPTWKIPLYKLEKSCESIHLAEITLVLFSNRNSPI